VKLNKTLVDRLCEQRLWWFWHVERMNTNRPPVRTLHLKLKKEVEAAREQDRLTVWRTISSRCIQ